MALLLLPEPGVYDQLGLDLFSPEGWVAPDKLLLVVYRCLLVICVHSLLGCWSKTGDSSKPFASGVGGDQIIWNLVGSACCNVCKWWLLWEILLRQLCGLARTTFLDLDCFVIFHRWVDLLIILTKQVFDWVFDMFNFVLRRCFSLN